MIQEAIITKIRDDGLAEVVVERMGICGGNCDECGGCKYDNLMKSVVQNPIGAHRGQHVYIETPTSKVFVGALGIYVLPLITMFLGYFALHALGGSEGICILASFIGLAVGFLITSVISKKRHSADPTPARITEIIYDQD